MKYILTTWVQASTPHLDSALDLIMDTCACYRAADREHLLPELAHDSGDTKFIYCSMKVGEKFVERIRNVVAPDDCGFDIAPIENGEAESAVKIRRLQELDLHCDGRRPCLDDCKRL